MKSLNKYSLNVKQDPLSFQGSVQTEISRRSSNSSTERIEEVFSFNTNQKTIVDYERQLMQQRTELFMQVWRNPLLYQEFIEFMTFSKSPIFIGVLNGLQTLFIFLPVLTFQIKNNYSSRITSILVVIEIIVGISAALSGWLLYFCITENSYLHNIGKLWFQWNTRSDWKQITGRVQLITYVCVVLRHGIALIRRTLTGTCVNPSLLYSWTCNPQSSSHIFPLDSACISMLIPIFFCVVYREARIEVNIAAWLTVLFCLTTSCIILNSLQPVVMLLVYVALSIVIMIDAFQQYLLFFWLGRQLKKTLEANQKLAEQNKASDMRNIIANVAHDLKTPLSSFMTGVDIIAADLNEFQARIESTLSDCDIEQSKNDFPTLTPEYISTFASGLQSCIANIRNTNAFMLMTINRCLDYTKASNGLKLVPKNETIDLAETLKMPLQCMTNIQQKIKICLMPYGEQGICSHVITDKQWLQENVLCLLSNAVKYSAGGEVVIKVSKTSNNQELFESKVPYSIEDEVLACETSKPMGKLMKYQSYGNLMSRPRAQDFLFPSHGLKVFPSSTTDQCEVEDDFQSKPLRRPNTLTDLGLSTSAHSSYRSSEELMFEVVDTGIGMSEEAMKTLFNPFKQTQRLAGGTGLGLYSLAKRIEALKGKYGVHQREDGKQGCVFWFTVPYKPDEVSATVSSSLYSHRLNHEGAMRNSNLSNGSSSNCTTAHVANKPTNDDNCTLSVLLAEDTPSIAKMTTMMLRRQKHQTEVAENGQIVLDKLYGDTDCTRCADEPLRVPNERKYDVVLMDLQMPVMDGLEATRRIRAHEQDLASTVRLSHCLDLHSYRSPHQIVIGVSANSDHETMEEALKAGIDDFLPKPFSVDAFLEVVKRIQGRIYK